MKNLFITLCSFSLIQVIYSQNLENLINSKKHIQANIILLQDSLRKIEDRIESELTKKSYEILDNNIIRAIINESSPRKSLPEIAAKNLGFVNKGDTIEVFPKIFESYNIQFLKCKDSGYVYLKYIEKNPYILILEKEMQNQKDSIKNINNIEFQKAQSERKGKLIKAFGEFNAKKILENKIWIGMTANMAIQSWGNPEKINKTVSSYGKREQWVYPNNQYLYFDNDILTAWQD